MRIERFLETYLPELGQGISTEPNPRKEPELGEQGKRQPQGNKANTNETNKDRWSLLDK